MRRSIWTLSGRRPWRKFRDYSFNGGYSYGYDKKASGGYLGASRISVSTVGCAETNHQHKREVMLSHFKVHELDSM